MEQVSSQSAVHSATQAENSTQSSRPSHSSRGRARGRSRGGIAASEQQRASESPRRARGGRQVARPRGTNQRPNGRGGGSLRKELDDSSLHGDAPEFVPGQVHQTRASAKPRGIRQQQHTARPRRDSRLKSTAADIATRTHEDIDNGLYECPICTSEVLRRSKVWSCKTCWTVFHLDCIKKWSANEGSTLARQRTEEGASTSARQWRCPGCNLPKEDLPSSYFCWCEKDIDPVTISGLPPHSCGQTCGKQRIMPKKCPHPCEQLCHAGPCPPCRHMGPTQICFCGKNPSSRPCVDTNYDSGWSCGEICGDLLPCGEHTCSRPCHEGLCGACEVPVVGRCYCGKISKTILCNDKGDEKTSEVRISHDWDPEIDQWAGIFQCQSECGRLFDCGKHACERKCHTQDLESAHCPRSPDMVKLCPCGKTSLSDISFTPRMSCEDPIPNCSQICSKQLRCGHTCLESCHAGDCPPCFRKVDISCNCGRTITRSMCLQGTGESPQCTRVCHANLNCGRHECGERCCSGERKATERQATKRKLRPLGVSSRVLEEGFEAEHICTRQCSRTLKCGNHQCPELCHKGPCGSCREAIFEEISCHCGRTVLQPPLPCGTKPPPCRFDCDRTRPCGHPQVPHNCHIDEDSCPKCPFLVEKACLCGKKTLRNQPCFLAEVRCGGICGKKLRCGSHFCRKQCHRPGECADAGKPCTQPCGKAKKACGHPCEESCHAPSVCKEDKPCQHKLMITCDCQHLKTETKCLASKTSEGNTKKSLKCDDECARLERNRKLALALNIDPATHTNEHVPYSAQTLKLYQETFKWPNKATEPGMKWAHVQEKELRVFAADETAKRLRFKPMPSHQRAFIHALAEDFGFDSESMDPEPHRHVAVFKTPRFVMAPMKTLAECVRIRTTAVTTTPTPSATTASTSAQPLQLANAPFNGFVLLRPRFGLTIDEVHNALKPALAKAPSLAFDIAFQPDESVVLKARPNSTHTSIAPGALASSLRTLKPHISTTLTATAHAEPTPLAASVALCALDASLNITRRESDPADTNGGWSQVAAKAAAGLRFAPRPEVVGGKSSYVVLGRRAERKRAEEERREVEAEVEVVDSWEEEMEGEDEEGAGVGGSGSAVDGKGEGSGSGEKADD